MTDKAGTPLTTRGWLLTAGVAFALLGLVLRFIVGIHIPYALDFWTLAVWAIMFVVNVVRSV